MSHFGFQVVDRAARSDILPHVGSTAPSPASSGPPTFFQGPPSLLDTETDEYMDYTGCSPGAVSSGSSTMDRSCSSTPVGNESTAAGELRPGASGGVAGQEGAAGAWDLPACAGPSSQGPALWSPSWHKRLTVKSPQRKMGQCAGELAGMGRRSWSPPPASLPTSPARCPRLQLPP